MLGAVASVTALAVTSSGEAAPPPVPTAPFAPTLDSVTPGNGQNTLVYHSNGDGFSPITTYRIMRGTAPGSLAQIATDAESPYVDATAANGTLYYYAVEAVNAIGTSDPSNVLSGRPSTVPAAPTLNSATPGDSQVNLAWTAGGTGGLPILGYEIHRGLTLETMELLATDDASPFLDVTPTNGTTYIYGVAAANANGVGPRSNTLSATPTGAAVPAPEFTTPPSVSPTTQGFATQTEYTISYGEASNASVYAVSWVLNGSPAGSSTKYTPASAGNMVPRVTATGPGGSTTVTLTSIPIGPAMGPPKTTTVTHAFTPPPATSNTPKLVATVDGYTEGDYIDWLFDTVNPPVESAPTPGGSTSASALELQLDTLPPGTYFYRARTNMGTWSPIGTLTVAATFFSDNFDQPNGTLIESYGKWTKDAVSGTTASNLAITSNRLGAPSSAVITRYTPIGFTTAGANRYYAQIRYIDSAAGGNAWAAIRVAAPNSFISIARTGTNAARVYRIRRRNGATDGYLVDSPARVGVTNEVTRVIDDQENDQIIIEVNGEVVFTYPLGGFNLGVKAVALITSSTGGGAVDDFEAGVLP